ncbi:MAG TPA: hypothetical protein DCS84_13800, partial [Microbacterium sp.]|nr:hypothetical protein [Microbacterium sp.]
MLNLGVCALLARHREREPSTRPVHPASAAERPPERDSRTSPFDQESSTIVTRTYTPKAGEAQREWLVIDATDVVLGRLASHAAALLRGKHKPT